MTPSVAHSLPPRLFCHWEPAGSLPAYLKLCMATWTRHLPGVEVVCLDEVNVGGYLRPGTYPQDAMNVVPLSPKKEILQWAILEQHGGVFMDVDTLLTGGLDPLLRYLDVSDVLMFDAYLGFIASRPHAPLLARLVDRVNERFATLTPEDIRALSWSALGNDLLSDEMRRANARHLLGRVYAAADHLAHRAPAPLTRAWQQSVAALWRRAQPRLHQWLHASSLRQLPARRWGFIAEPVRDTRNPGPDYLRFWFDEVPAEPVTPRAHQHVIALHNSWTPAWYRSLSEAEVLAHPCRLSRTLAALLER